MWKRYIKYICINNNEIKTNFERINEENNFEKRINNYLKDELIEDIQFLNEEIWSATKIQYNVTRIEISISNNKKIIINLDESLSFMKIIIY